MRLKVVQINIYKGKYLNDLLSFLDKEDPDIITFQEVTSGIINLYRDKNLDLFNLLRDHLKQYDAVREIDFTINVDAGSLGNAVFSKFKIINSKVVRLKNQISISSVDAADESLIPTLPRHVLDAVCDVGGHRVHVMSWHGAWTAPPQDTPETLRQAKMVRKYLGELNKSNQPFILAGDLNNIAENQTIMIIEEAAVNTMRTLSLKSTLHPKVHKISPRGYPVDYIFTSKHFRVKIIQVPLILISDHLPVVAQLVF